LVRIWLFSAAIFCNDCFRKATHRSYIRCLFALHPVRNGCPAIPAQIEAARCRTGQADGGIRPVDPQFELAVVTTRAAAPPCAEPVAIEALDTRTPQRMRFLARCRTQAGASSTSCGPASARWSSVAAAPAAANEGLARRT
jgi:hypothetical protein